MAVLLQKKYQFLIVFLFVGLIVLGIGLVLLTNTFLQAIQPSAQQSPRQAPFNTDLLLLGITMFAGLPAIGIGTYLAYSGSQIRITSPTGETEKDAIIDTPIIKRTSPRMKGTLLMASGGLLILGGLVLPIVVWWMTQTL